MKRILLVIVMIFTGMITYQIVLSGNGLLEGLRVRREIEVYRNILTLIKNEDRELSMMIDNIKNDSSIYDYMATKYGITNGSTRLVRVINNETVLSDEVSEDEFKFDTLFSIIEKKYSGEIDYLIDNYLKYDSKINRYRLTASLFFYLFFGFFIVLGVFGSINTRKNKENKTD